MTRTGLVQSGDAGDLARFRAQFDREHCIHLPALFDAELSQLIDRGIEEAGFAHRTHGSIGLELCLLPHQTLDHLYFLMNDPRLFDALRKATGCGPIGCFLGRIYRVVPGSDHHDSWHNDMTDHRILGLSVNLGTLPYAGGVFQLRQAGAGTVLYEIANTGPGDAIVFRIAASLEHRITAMSGGTAKTAFAGWFKSEPDFLSLLTSQGSSATANGALLTETPESKR